MARPLHFEFHRGMLSVMDDSMGAPAYTGAMHTGGAMSQSFCELSRPGKMGMGGFPVGRIVWHAGSGHFDLQLASGRPVPMRRSNILSRKTTLGSSTGELTWKGDGMLHASLKLVNSSGMEVAHLGSLMTISSRNMGKLQLLGPAAQDSELMDEVVLSAIGMLMQEKATELSGIVFGSIASLG